MNRFSLLIVAIVLVCGLGATAGAADNVADGMVFIPGGEFQMGSTDEEVAEFKEKYGQRDLYKEYPFFLETPKKRVAIGAFYIDRHEVTNREYAAFVQATHHAIPVNWHSGSYEAGKGDHPVLFVSQADAMDYARWAGKRLPTEEEWEKAARGSDGRIFPWGNVYDPYHTVTAESDMRLIAGAICEVALGAKVELAEGDVSPYGVHDMAGNVREWTSTVDDGEPEMVVVKGGAWADLSINARAAHKEYIPKTSRSHLIGFRCVKDLEE